MEAILATLADPFLHRFWWRAAVLAALLGVAGACLGTILITRRLALIGDALSHALLPGIGIAWLLAGTSLIALLLGAVGAGILALLGAALLARMTRLKEDVAVAALLATAFAVGVVLVTKVDAGVNLTHALFGNLLAIGSDDLTLALIVHLAVVWTFALGWRAIVLHAFDPGYLRLTSPWAMLIHPWLLVLLVADLAASLRTMGAVTAMGMILLPAATAALWCATIGRSLALAAVIAVVGALGGMWIAWHLGLPPGPSVVALLGGGFLMSAAVGRRGGFLARQRHAPHLHRTPGEDSHG